MRAILDTSVLIAGCFELGPGVDVSVASLSYGELRFGLSSATVDDRERAIRRQRFANLYRLFGEGIPFDDVASESFGIITELVLARGRSVRNRTMDLLIAAVAHSRNAMVITLNPGDFAPLESIMEIRLPTQPAR